MEIRRLYPSDAKIYQDIRLQALLDSPENYSSSYDEEKERPLEFIENRLKQESVSTYGAFIEEVLIGIITLAKETRVKTKHTADIFGMYVDVNYRKQGIGRALVSYVISKAIQNQVTEKIRLSVTDTNTSAIRLYESLGFKRYCHELNSIKMKDTYYGTYYMVLDLSTIK